MTTPVLTAAVFQLPVNQPISMGNVKRALITFDFSTYATNGKQVTTAGPIGKVLAISPLGAVTDTGAIIQILDTDPTTIKLRTAVSAAVEFADGTDGGEFLAWVDGTG